VPAIEENATAFTPWQDRVTLAEHLSISPTTVDNWGVGGILPRPRDHGGKLVWPWDEVGDQLRNGPQIETNQEHDRCHQTSTRRRSPIAPEHSIGPIRAFDLTAFARERSDASFGGFFVSSKHQPRGVRLAFAILLEPIGAGLSLRPVPEQREHWDLSLTGVPHSASFIIAGSPCQSRSRRFRRRRAFPFLVSMIRSPFPDPRISYEADQAAQRTDFGCRYPRRYPRAGWPIGRFS